MYLQQQYKIQIIFFFTHGFKRRCRGKQPCGYQQGSARPSAHPPRPFASSTHATAPQPTLRRACARPALLHRRRSEGPRSHPEGSASGCAEHPGDCPADLPGVSAVAAFIRAGKINSKVFIMQTPNCRT